jgi:probable HAF family extracellular repeat protein
MVFSVTVLTPNPVVTGEAFGINDSGVVVGQDDTSAFAWQPNQPNGTTGSLQRLPMLPVPPATPQEATAVAVNTGGDVVGFCEGVDANGSAVVRAVLWQSGQIRELGTLIPDPFHPGAFLGDSRALDVNDNGLVVGVSDSVVSVEHAMLVDPNVPVPRDLGSLIPFTSLPGTRDPSTANGINNGGDIVGVAAAFDSQGNVVDHAFLLSSGALLMTDLGTAQPLAGGAGLNSQAFGINDSTVVVGVSETGATLPGGGPLQAAVAFSVPPPPVNLLPVHAQALEVGPGGEVVGTFNDPPLGFLLPPGGGLVDLNANLGTPGVQILKANAINAVGQIAGRAQIGTDFVAVLLTP